MLIVIDLGNTNVVVGVHENDTWLHEWRMETHLPPSSESYATQLQSKIEESNLDVTQIHQIILSSVVPNRTQEIFEVATEVFKQTPTLFNSDIFHLLPMDIPSASEIGTDLVANAVAATYRFPNENCVVVDFGTALTFTTVSKDGQLLGVAIAPGIKTSLKALFMNAAQLPEVPLKVPDSVLGRDTFHAIQAGILVGYEGLIGHLLKRHREELKDDCRVIATGGLSEILENLKPEYDLIDRKLTLEGLRIIRGLITGYS